MHPTGVISRFDPVRALAVGLCALVTASGPAAAQAPGGAAPVSVTVAAVRRADVADLRERVGQVEAIEDVEIRARIEGYLEQRPFVEGSYVEKGALLFVLEKEQYQAEVQRLEAELERERAARQKAELDLSRAKRLRSDGNISQADLDAAQATRDQAAAEVMAREAELRRARLDLSYTEIRAPFDGRVSRSRYSIGDLVGPDSGALTTLVKLDPIHVYWTAGEQIALDFRRANLARVERGEAPLEVTANLRFSDGSGYAHPGRWDFLDNRVDPSTGTQTVRAVFPNPERLLVPGQYVTVIVQVGESEPALVIPQSAVQEDLEGRFVLVVGADGTVEQRRVTMGARQGIFWVVSKGLADGEQVIYQGIQKARPGAKVKAVLANPPDPARPTANEF